MAFTVEHVKRLLQRDLVTELEKVKIAKGSSIKDVRINLGIFGTPPYACPGLSAFGWPPPHPARVDTRLALFETLQLVNNSHWRVKKTDHSDTGCTHVCSYYTTSINCIPKDGIASVPKSLSGKSKLSKFHKYGRYNFFPSGRPHLGNQPLPLLTFVHFCLIPLPPMCGHPLWMAPKIIAKIKELP